MVQDFVSLTFFGVRKRDAGSGCIAPGLAGDYLHDLCIRSMLFVMKTRGGGVSS